MQHHCCQENAKKKPILHQSYLIGSNYIYSTIQRPLILNLLRPLQNIFTFLCEEQSDSLPGE
ncbi:MAG: hypothetical protein CVU54_18595 [Deltaproteobacteria bacterium HGW-Deltaproteobacteria-12]|nr:MAG: hypothetical protein CVU54_18595 [Deltaproteobacteria bacterium HGW-Deltaproteobacteria-12]